MFKQPQTPALQSSFIFYVGDYNNPFTFGSGVVYSPLCDLLADINTDICLFSLAPGKIDKSRELGFHGWAKSPLSLFANIVSFYKMSQKVSKV